MHFTSSDRSVGRARLDADALPPFTFIPHQGFHALILARVLDSLVRVSRRVQENHFASAIRFGASPGLVPFFGHGRGALAPAAGTRRRRARLAALDHAVRPPPAAARPHRSRQTLEPPFCGPIRSLLLSPRSATGTPRSRWALTSGPAGNPRGPPPLPANFPRRAFPPPANPC